jgi:hypothetical protein
LSLETIDNAGGIVVGAGSSSSSVLLAGTVMRVMFFRGGSIDVVIRGSVVHKNAREVNRSKQNIPHIIYVIAQTALCVNEKQNEG